MSHKRFKKKSHKRFKKKSPKKINTLWNYNDNFRNQGEFKNN